MNLIIKTFLYLCVICFFIVYFIYSGNFTNNYVPLLISTNVSVVKATYHQECKPIINGSSYETFLIDGVSYPRYQPMFLNTSYNFTCMNENNKSKVILYWNKRYNADDFHYGIGKNDVFKRNSCPVWNCEATNDRQRINESDIILFSIWDEIDELPKWRQPHQKWVFMLIEAPHRMDEQIKWDSSFKSRNFSRFHDGLFNLSLTYRFNSNFTPDYTHQLMFKWKENRTYNVDKNFMRNKTKFAFQVVSNCYAASKREIYVNELQKYIQVDMFGGCGKPCPNLNDAWTSFDCKRMLIPQYKFYLAFENSICQDYISEKFNFIVKHDIIPVVYGGGQYDMHVPKSGYINAFDFESPQQLAEYMTKVANNDTLYNSFFKWKRYVSFITYPRYQQICEMCIMLNLEQYNGVRYSVIDGYSKFWNTKQDCKTLNTDTFQIMPL